MAEGVIDTSFLDSRSLVDAVKRLVDSIEDHRRLSDITYENDHRTSMERPARRCRYPPRTDEALRLRGAEERQTYVRLQLLLPSVNTCRPADLPD